MAKVITTFDPKTQQLIQCSLPDGTVVFAIATKPEREGIEIINGAVSMMVGKGVKITEVGMSPQYNPSLFKMNLTYSTVPQEKSDEVRNEFFGCLGDLRNQANTVMVSGLVHPKVIDIKPKQTQ